MMRGLSHMKFARAIRRFRRDESGASAVEFALTFPVYIATIMFFVEMCRLAYTQGVIIHAAEEATRYALVHYDATTEEVQDKARAALIGLTHEHLTAILVTAPVDPADQTKLVTVQVRYNYTPILPYGALLGGENANSLSLSGESKGFITEEIPTT